MDAQCLHIPVEIDTACQAAKLQGRTGAAIIGIDSRRAGDEVTDTLPARFEDAQCRADRRHGIALIVPSDRAFGCRNAHGKQSVAGNAHCISFAGGEPEGADVRAPVVEGGTLVFWRTDSGEAHGARPYRFTFQVTPEMVAR